MGGHTSCCGQGAAVHVLIIAPSSTPALAPHLGRLSSEPPPSTCKGNSRATPGRLATLALRAPISTNTGASGALRGARVCHPWTMAEAGGCALMGGKSARVARHQRCLTEAWAIESSVATRASSVAARGPPQTPHTVPTPPAHQRGQNPTCSEGKRRGRTSFA